MRELFDLLSEFTYDSEGEVACPVFLQNFVAMLDKADEYSDEEASPLLAYTLRESPLAWCCSLLVGSMHSLEQFCDLIESTFHHFDREPLDQKMLQWKAPHESPMNFW